MLRSLLTSTLDSEPWKPTPRDSHYIRQCSSQGRPAAGAQRRSVGPRCDPQRRTQTTDCRSGCYLGRRAKACVHRSRWRPRSALMRQGEAVFVDSGAWIALALSRDPLAQAREQWELLH